jgi:hypothetical protein
MCYFMQPLHNLRPIREVSCITNYFAAFICMSTYLHVLEYLNANEEILRNDNHCIGRVLLLQSILL